jgi:hypothetical protein
LHRRFLGRIRTTGLPAAGAAMSTGVGTAQRAPAAAAVAAEPVAVRVELAEGVELDRGGIVATLGTVERQRATRGPLCPIVAARFAFQQPAGN